MATVFHQFDIDDAVLENASIAEAGGGLPRRIVPSPASTLIVGDKFTFDTDLSNTGLNQSPMTLNVRGAGGVVGGMLDLGGYAYPQSADLLSTETGFCPPTSPWVVHIRAWALGGGPYSSWFATANGYNYAGGPSTGGIAVTSAGSEILILAFTQAGVASTFLRWTVPASFNGGTIYGIPVDVTVAYDGLNAGASSFRLWVDGVERTLSVVASGVYQQNLTTSGAISVGGWTGGNGTGRGLAYVEDFQYAEQVFAPSSWYRGTATWALAFADASTVSFIAVPTPDNADDIIEVDLLVNDVSQDTPSHVAVVNVDVAGGSTFKLAATITGGEAFIGCDGLKGGPGIVYEGGNSPSDVLSVVSRSGYIDISIAGLNIGNVAAPTNDPLPALQIGSAVRFSANTLRLNIPFPYANVTSIVSHDGYVSLGFDVPIGTLPVPVSNPLPAYQIASATKPTASSIQINIERLPLPPGSVAVSGNTDFPPPPVDRLDVEPV